MLPFVMLNPSTADASNDDPTIRRCMGFARREGAGGIIVVNLHAFRSASPRDLTTAADPIGPENQSALVHVAQEATATCMPVVCAWGAHGGIVGGFDKAAAAMFRRFGARTVCLGKTAHGHPRHPLYVKGDAPLVAF